MIGWLKENATMVAAVMLGPIIMAVLAALAVAAVAMLATALWPILFPVLFYSACGKHGIFTNNDMR